MSFLPSVPPRAVERAAPIKANRHARSHHIDTTVPGSEPFHRGLIDQRPALVEEKLKLHARIIDEFNLTVLEKLPRAELVKQVQAGNEVLLTQGNKPVARIVPSPQKETAQDAALRIRSLKGHRILTPLISQADLAEEMFRRE